MGLENGDLRANATGMDLGLRCPQTLELAMDVFGWIRPPLLPLQSLDYKLSPWSLGPPGEVQGHSGLRM